MKWKRAHEYCVCVCVCFEKKNRKTSEMEHPPEDLTQRDVCVEFRAKRVPFLFIFLSKFTPNREGRGGGGHSFVLLLYLILNQEKERMI